jgi:hypothetical protein
MVKGAVAIASDVHVENVSVFALWDISMMLYKFLVLHNLQTSEESKVAVINRDISGIQDSGNE